MIHPQTSRPELKTSVVGWKAVLLTAADGEWIVQTMAIAS